MTAKLHVVTPNDTDIPLQSASLDIWDSKYRLKTKDGRAIDETIDDTYKRVAKALSSVEKTKALQEKHYKEFLWALRKGVIPAGRIVSTPARWNTNRPPRPLTAPCPASSKTRWTTSCARSTKPA